MKKVIVISLFFLTIMSIGNVVSGQVLLSNKNRTPERQIQAKSNLPTVEDVGWILYYLTSYYSKWEAEKNQPDDNAIGIKHRYGQAAEWKGNGCWSSIGLTGPKDSLMFGPHYYQEKIYKRYLFFPWANPYSLSYTPRIRMALDNSQAISNMEDVCRIKVVHRFKMYHSPDSVTTQDTVLLERVLKVSDFENDGSFNNYYFGTLPLIIYEYAPVFTKNNLDSVNSKFPKYSDSETGLGIQFCVDWLMNNDLCTLYIDYAEIYDNDGWNGYLTFPNEIAERMKEYINSYLNWKHIPFLSSQIKPTSIDEFIPIKTIDSLFRAVGAPTLLSQKHRNSAILNSNIEVPYPWNYNKDTLHPVLDKNLRMNKADEKE